MVLSDYGDGMGRNQKLGSTNKDRRWTVAWRTAYSNLRGVNRVVVRIEWLWERCGNREVVGRVSCALCSVQFVLGGLFCVGPQLF